MVIKTLYTCQFCNTDYADKESIHKRDEELDKKDKMNKELRRWLFR